MAHHYYHLPWPQAGFQWLWHPTYSFSQGATTMGELRAAARRKECDGALPELPPGSRIHVDDTAGASGEASGSTCRMGWTGSRRPEPRRVTAKHQEVVN